MKTFKQIVVEAAKGIGGYEMKLIKSATDDEVNITYELWKGKEKAGTRVVDNDAKETVDLRIYPIDMWKKAEKAYNDAIKEFK